MSEIRQLPRDLWLAILDKTSARDLGRFAETSRDGQLLADISFCAEQKLLRSTRLVATGRPLRETLKDTSGNVGSHLLAAFRPRLASADPATREQALEQLRGAVEICRKLPGDRFAVGALAGEVPAACVENLATLAATMPARLQPPVRALGASVPTSYAAIEGSLFQGIGGEGITTEDQFMGLFAGEDQHYGCRFRGDSQGNAFVSVRMRVIETEEGQTYASARKAHDERYQQGWAIRGDILEWDLHLLRLSSYGHDTWRGAVVLRQPTTGGENQLFPLSSGDLSGAEESDMSETLGRFIPSICELARQGYGRWHEKVPEQVGGYTLTNEWVIFNA